MAILDASLTAQLTQLVQLIKQPIALAASLGSDDVSAQTNAPLDETAVLRPEIITVTSEANERTPPFATVP